jgi:predicted glycogen debranching enzyme
MVSLPTRSVPLESRAHAPAANAPGKHDSRGQVDAPLEWLVTNGLGGYASGLVNGGVSRRYHGLLVAALPAPLGRTLVLDFVRPTIVERGVEHLVEHEDSLTPPGTALQAFVLEGGLPIWRYAVSGIHIEKRVVMPAGHNAVVVTFRILNRTGPISLRLRPFAHLRSHDARLVAPAPAASKATRVERVGHHCVEVDAGTGLPPVRWRVDGPSPVWTMEAERRAITYSTEERRGYEFQNELWSPGFVELAVGSDQPAAFIATTELWDFLDAISPDRVLADEQARRRELLTVARTDGDAVAAELTLAADQFLVSPVGRAEEVARARAAGDESRSVIAGYHWFTDWGRDTMISLEGLTLTTGRAREAGCILRTFGRHMREGLIPNLFPEGAREGLYHTADATLWFFHAVDRYLAATRDRSLLIELLPRLAEAIEHHLAGTSFGIGADPADGLLRQGAPDYQLTWMDAKCDGWVVTPRRGKAVEINALWYNALCLAAAWFDQEHHATLAARCRHESVRVRRAFNARFWNGARNCLFDVVDGESGDDDACRPNQVFAISLPHAVLNAERWSPVLEVVRRDLLTPYGLRSLSPDHPDYQPTYFGNLRTRDAAYHQGTVWGWLIGPFVDAWLKVHPHDLATARGFLEAFVPHLGEAGAGSISEVFDARAPYLARGCIAQAWSVAEVLRAWRLTDAAANGEGSSG